MQLLWVILLGIAGVGCRFTVDNLVSARGAAAPVGTLTINLVGSMLAGVIYVLGTERALITPALSAGMLVGFCGGFTTFSAFSLQSVTLMEKGNAAVALGYLFVSPVLGFAAAYLGVLAARSFSGV